MPRTGGIYSPPAGTKGVPLTTILSSAFNAFIDDITADANAARPITAGGTGATSASGARTALGLEIGTNVQAQDPGLQSISNLVTAAGQMLYTTAPDVYATTALTAFARTLLDDADAAAARATLGADNASNITLGTLADARLPTTTSPKVFTGGITMSGGAGSTMALYYAIGGTDRARLVADGPADIVALQKFSNTGVFQSQLQINGAGATDLKFRNSTIWTAENDGPSSGLYADNSDKLNGQLASYYLNAANFTGILPTVSLPNAMGNGKTFTDNIYLNGTSNVHLWFQNNGVSRGLVYYTPPTSELVWQLHNSSGTFVRLASFRQSDGRFYVDGFMQASGAVYAGTDGAALNTNGNITFAGAMASYGASLSNALNDRIKNDGGTYGINITGNAATVGGLAASAFKRSPSTSTNASETNFPIGHVVVAEGIINRNQAANIYLHGSLAYGYQVSPVGAGAICAGTWLGRGGSAAGSTFTTLERIA